MLIYLYMWAQIRTQAKCIQNQSISVSVHLFGAMCFLALTLNQSITICDCPTHIQLQGYTNIQHGIDL